MFFVINTLLIHINKRYNYLGDYEKKANLSTITDATITSDALFFSVSTPIVNKYGEQVGLSVTTDARVKAYFRNNELIVLWLQGLPSVFLGDYNEELQSIQESFRLV